MTSDGSRDVGFMSGLSNSWIAVPIVSTAGVTPMKKLTPDVEEASDDTDNVLLECEFVNAFPFPEVF